MGERGPAPKPQESHKRDGTFVPSRHGSGRLPIEIPPMPPDLSPIAQGFWNTVTTQLKWAGIVTEVDGSALRLLCESWETYIEAGDDVRNNGITVLSVTKAGTNRIVNPAMKVRNDAWKQIYSMLRQFGLTPSARTGMTLNELTDEGDNIADILGIGVN